MTLLVIVRTREAEGNTASFSFETHTKLVCRIGRGKADIVLGDPRCSRDHALIYQAPDGSLRLRDLGSKNGTNLSGKRVVRDTALQVGDWIEIGATLVGIVHFVPSRDAGAPLLSRNLLRAYSQAALTR